VLPDLLKPVDGLFAVENCQARLVLHAPEGHERG
jgi:hypothetical protein